LDQLALNAGLAKLGLKANEIDDYDEDTGWLFWYELEPISNELSPEDQFKILYERSKRKVWGGLKEIRDSSKYVNQKLKRVNVFFFFLVLI
jgi:hypothetical protein